MGGKTKQDEGIYREIEHIYDLSDNVLDAIELEDIENPNEQILLAEPIVKQIQESAEMLVEVYADFVNNDKKPSLVGIRRIEGATRKIFVAISEFNEKVKNLSKQTVAPSNKIQKKKCDTKAALTVLKEVPNGIAIPVVMQELKDNLPESTIQNSLSSEAQRLGKKRGGLLIVAIKAIGDHMLALMHIFQKVGLGTVIKAIPNRSRSDLEINLQKSSRGESWFRR